MILGNGKDERRAIGHLDHFLDRAFAESFLAQHIAAGVIQNRGGHDLRRPGGAAIHQHHQRQAGDGLLRIGAEIFALVLLPAQRGDSASAQK